MQTIWVKTKEININDPLFERKIEIATDGLSHDCFNRLYERVAKLTKEKVVVTLARAYYCYKDKDCAYEPYSQLD
jgi:hypothetical protein